MSQIRERSGRYEFKYLMPVSQRAGVLEIADAYVQPDPHGNPLPDGASGYNVHSLYFDTPDLQDYFDRLASRKVRNRLRVRTYDAPGDDRPVFLENKRKLDDQVVKHRVRICSAREWLDTPGPTPWRPWIEGLRGRRRYAADVFRELVEDRGRVPVSTVHYRREVYVARDNIYSNVRLTLDRRVCAAVNPDVRGLFAAPDVDLIPPDWMVMELKFSGTRPGWMRQVVCELGLRATPVSKFGLSVALGQRAAPARELRFFTPRPLKHTVQIQRAAVGAK